MVDITSIGDVNIDLLILGKVFSKDAKNEQEFVNNIIIKVGGGAANFSIWASKLKMKVRLIGCLGKDIFSNFIINELKRFGIETKIAIENTNTGITLAYELENGRKQLLTYRGSNTLFSIKHIPLNLLEGEVLYLSGYNLLDNLRKDFITLANRAKEKGMIVCLDPDIKANINFNKEEFFELVKKVDVLFMNEEECKKVSKNLDWFKNRTIVIKRGSKGAFAIENGERVEVEGVKIEKVLNTTGAGDVFNASFLHHYYFGYDLRECLEFANEQAAEYIKEINLIGTKS
ncbi:MAG: carbohydrate kinase family protein [Candidatus Aenigmatarchaeota archaeon]